MSHHLDCDLSLNHLGRQYLWLWVFKEVSNLFVRFYLFLQYSFDLFELIEIHLHEITPLFLILFRITFSFPRLFFCWYHPESITGLKAKMLNEFTSNRILIGLINYRKEMLRIMIHFFCWLLLIKRNCYFSIFLWQCTNPFKRST